MEDNKDLLNENEALENGENTSDALNEELEQIAQAFREELQKATDEAEQETQEEAAPDTVEGESEEDAVPEEELCARCGENLRDKEYGEHYEYCAECREKMRRAPLSFSSVLIAVLMGVMAVISVITFLKDADGYYYSYQAKSLKNNKMLNSALSYYDEAISYFEGKDVKAVNLYLESAEVISKTMSQGTASMDLISDRISTALEGSSAKLPIYRKSVKLRNDNLNLYGTMQAFYNIVNNEKYANYSVINEEMYNSVIADVEALVGTELSVTALDGETTETVVANEAMLRFCQYMFAYSAGKTEDVNKYLMKVYELEPDFLWLYAYELGMIHTKNGKYEEAEKIAERVLDVNKEEADGYYIYSSIARLSDDVTGSVKWADKGLELCPQDTELLRVKAMACVANDDLEGAKEAIDEAMTYDSYGLLYYTAIVIENELGNTDSVNEMISVLQSGGLSLSARLNSYLNGEITAKQMFTEGTGDVE